jgi:hypothetical protein
VRNPAPAKPSSCHLRIEAERARNALFETAKRHGVKCTFEVVRGALSIAAARASEHDLVVAAAGVARLLFELTAKHVQQNLIRERLLQDL